MGILSNFSFELPTRIEYGQDVIRKLPGVLEELSVRRLLLVSDPGVTEAGILVPITEILEEAGYAADIFSDVEPNPRDRNVREGAEAARATGAKCIIAIGGGSPIDCAKGIAVVASLGGSIRDYEGANRIEGEVLPIIAIPTTAGTGSEVTFSSVITDSSEKVKFSLRSTRIAPVVALADPAMTMTMPPELTASTGMDALTHAIEGFTARNSNPLSDAAALHAIELISENLEAAVGDGTNIEARAGMLLGSVLAGISFSHSDVGAVHCLAEALGGAYDLPHGLCNAIILPEVMEYNLECCPDRYAHIARIMKNVEGGAREAASAVKALGKRVGISDFNTLGVRPGDFEKLARISAANGSNFSNPRPMDEHDYLELLSRLGKAL